MKRFLNHYLSLTFIASLFLITSCGEDPVEPGVDAPAIEFSGDQPETVEVGETVSFTVNAATPEGFNRLFITKEVGTLSPVTVIDTSRAAGSTAPTSITYDFTYTPTAEEAGETVFFDFLLVDDEGNDATATYTVEVNEIPFEEYTTILLGGQLHGTEPSFYNAIDNERMGYTAANANPNEVDFVYYYVTSGDTPPEATIGAPANEETRITWNSTENSQGEPLTLSDEMDNETSFKNVTTTTYADITTGGQLVDAYVENLNTANTRITNLVEGQTFAFVLDEDRGSRIGVVEVADISGESGAERTITLNVKVQTVDNQ